MQNALTSKRKGGEKFPAVSKSKCTTAGDLWLNFRPISQFDREGLWEQIDSAVQSNSDFVMDESLKVTTAIVQLPEGRGRVVLSHEDVNKKSILVIKNTDNLCLPRSIVAGLAHAVHAQHRTGPLHDHWNRIRKSNSTLQTALAETLLRESGVVIPISG